MKPALSKGMIVADLDGTLVGTDGNLNQSDLNALAYLKTLGIVRVIATGRSLYSFRNSVGNTLPADYVIFSTGAGIMTYPEETLIRKNNLDSLAVSAAVQAFVAIGLDFMIHRAVPDNHHFVYYWTGRENPDFHRRINRYKEFCMPCDIESYKWESASQLLGVVNHDNIDKILGDLKHKLTDCSVIRSTSPLDGKSTWIEVFAGNVCKSNGAAWIAHKLNIERENVFAVGNDYNDLDLLDWAGKGFIVRNAPEDIKKRFHTVNSNDSGGVAEAIQQWLKCRWQCNCSDRQTSGFQRL